MEGAVLSSEACQEDHMDRAGNRHTSFVQSGCNLQPQLKGKVHWQCLFWASGGGAFLLSKLENLCSTLPFEI